MVVIGKINLEFPYQHHLFHPTSEKTASGSSNQNKSTLKRTMQLRDATSTANCAAFNFCLLFWFCVITKKLRESLEWTMLNLRGFLAKLKNILSSEMAKYITSTHWLKKEVISWGNRGFSRSKEFWRYSVLPSFWWRNKEII